MDDSAKTREELIAELQELRRQVVELQAPAVENFVQAALPESSRLIRKIIANVPIIVFALDRNGIILLSEGKGLDALGFEPGELVGQSAFEVYPDSPDIESTMHDVLSGESSSMSTKVGDIVFEVWTTPLRDRQGEVIGAAGMAVDVTQRKQGEEELRAEQRVMELMLRAQERDRQLIAYEIHDGLVQDATGALMQLQTLLQADRLPPGFSREQVQRAAELIGKSVAEARQLIGGLRPPILDELGVVPAIEYLVGQRQADEPALKFTAAVQFDRLEPLLEVTIYRIVQEAITNLKRHSQSDRAEIRLTQVGERIHLEIQDWGIGFSPESIAENRFGLQGIRERTRLLRGRAVIDSAPGKGTRVFIELPVALAPEKVASANTGSI